MSPRRRSIVVLGMMSKHPVPGVIWQTVQYLIGFERLGFDAYYVEAGGHQPSAMLVDSDDRSPDRSLAAAGFLDDVLRRFDLGDKWALDAVHTGECHGLSLPALRSLYENAHAIINLHGGTTPRAEHASTGRLIYLETDPVQLQIELYRRRPSTIAFLEPHAAFFTFGENYGTDRCGLPQVDGIRFHPTRQPIVGSFWDQTTSGAGSTFTTVGNWEQRGRPVRFRGEVYHWSKHLEFRKFLDLPARTGQSFELALSPTSVRPTDASLLAAHGWQVRDALSSHRDLDAYRRYIQGSRGEFTVAKDQNVRFRTGWFSDRSASYLAAARPVITQETGFSDILPTGTGLIGFSTLEEGIDAVQRVCADYARHSAAALAVAREHFDSDVVLRPLLAQIGVVALGTRRASSVRIEDAHGSAIDRVEQEIVTARETVRSLRVACEREQQRVAANGEASLALPANRDALREARAQLHTLRLRLAALEDDQDAGLVARTAAGEECSQ